MDFILHSDHHPLKYLNSQKKLNDLHARWVEFLQKFHYSFHHKSGHNNKVAYALSRKAILLTLLKFDLQEFEHLKELYAKDEDFAKIWIQCLQHNKTEDFHILDAFLFKAN